MKIIIDADAVPRKVLAICKKAAVAFSRKNERILMTRDLRRTYINGCANWLARSRQINCRQVVLGSMDVF
jgi:uncharacterized protein YbbK (DUF523 family)